MSEEQVGSDTQQLSQESPEVSTEASEPTAVDLARRQEEVTTAAERPKYLGEYDSEDAAKAEMQRLKREHEESNRRLEEFNRSERIQQARAQDEQERRQIEEAEHERYARSRAVRDEAAKWIERGNPDKAFAIMEAYNLQNAAAVAKYYVDQVREEVRPLLTRAQAEASRQQFLSAPGLEHLRDFDQEAITLQQRGWKVQEIVPFLEQLAEKTGKGGKKREEDDTVVDFEDHKDRTRREARSLAPGGGGSAPRKSAAIQEKEAKQRSAMFMEMYGPLAKRQGE